jgi:iron complex transport system permease protein
MFAACLLFGLAMMRHVSSQTLILAGIALLFLFQSLLSLLTVPLLPELNQQILFWLFGSLMRTTWDSLIITAVVTLICTLLIYRDAWASPACASGKPAPAASGSTSTDCA